MDLNEIIKSNVEVSDMELLVSKGLYKDDDFTSRFYTIYKNYRLLLDKYLVNLFLLDSYDKSIDEAELRFSIVPEENMDFYQYISNMGLKYFYLRNDIYIEKLSEDILNTVFSISDEELNNPNDKLFNIIASTYKQVIDSNNDSDAMGMKRYGPDYDNYWFPSNELVLGFRYDDFADNGLGEGSEWEENNNKQIAFINALLREMRVKFSQIADDKINIVWYNDFTIGEAVLRK